MRGIGTCQSRLRRLLFLALLFSTSDCSSVRIHLVGITIIILNSAIFSQKHASTKIHLSYSHDLSFRRTRREQNNSFKIFSDRISSQWACSGVFPHSSLPPHRAKHLAPCTLHLSRQPTNMRISTVLHPRPLSKRCIPSHTTPHSKYLHHFLSTMPV